MSPYEVGLPEYQLFFSFLVRIPQIFSTDFERSFFPKKKRKLIPQRAGFGTGTWDSVSELAPKIPNGQYLLQPVHVAPPDSALRAPRPCSETPHLDRGGGSFPPLLPAATGPARPLRPFKLSQFFVSLKNETQEPPGSHLCSSSEPSSDELNSHVHFQNRLLAARQRN